MTIYLVPVGIISCRSYVKIIIPGVVYVITLTRGHTLVCGQQDKPLLLVEGNKKLIRTKKKIAPSEQKYDIINARTSASYTYHTYFKYAVELGTGNRRTKIQEEKEFPYRIRDMALHLVHLGQKNM